MGQCHKIDSSPKMYTNDHKAYKKMLGITNGKRNPKSKPQ